MRTVPILLLAGMLAVGCGGGSDRADDGRLDVVASFYPLAEVARVVGGDQVRVHDLTAPGVEPHDIELTTDQVDLVLDADVVIAMGRRFQAAVDAAVGKRHGRTLQLLSALHVAGDDPHIWLDLGLLQQAVTTIASTLAAEDPAHAADYRSRGEAMVLRLQELDRAWRDGLKSCRSRVLVTSHAAFGRLAARYGLRQEAVAGFEPSQEPDPKRLAELVDLVRREGVTTVFTEPLLSPRVADALAREAGATTAVLDPVESISKAGLAAGDDVERVMRRNLAAVRTGLGCP